MEIQFDIDKYPIDPSGYKAIAFTEGTLTILFGGQKFFEEEGILLLEFAHVLRIWLGKVSNGKCTAFDYCSMDIEEEPVLRLEPQGPCESFMPTSAFQLYNKPSLVSLNGIVASVHSYIDRLTDDIESTLKMESGALWEGIDAPS